MLASKTKSGLSDTSNSKTPPAPPNANKIVRAGSTKSASLPPSSLQSSRSSIDRSPASINSKLALKNSNISVGQSPKSANSKLASQNSRFSVDQSPKSVESKPTLERRLSKTSKLPDKQPLAVKGSEAQAHPVVAQEDLEKAREQLALVEQEKAKALQESKDAKRLADEASEKLNEAIIAQKRAEESSEIAKFRADELEQASLEAAQKREHEWRKELENVHNQHAVDVAALLSTSQELERVKHELALTSDEKNDALSHANDATKLADMNAEKVELLSIEVSSLKASFDSKMDSMKSETTETVKKLDSEVDALKHELERSKEAADDMEALVEGLKSELTVAKRSEVDASELVNEWKMKAETINDQLEKAKQYENGTRELVKKLDSELDALKRELAISKAAEDKLVEMEALVQQLTTETNDLKRAQVDAGRLIDEWKFKAEALEVRVVEAKHYENEASELVKKLDSDVDTLKHELEIAKKSEDRLVEMEALVERLRTELNVAKKAEIDGSRLVDEWKRKAELLQVRVEAATKSEESSLDSLALVSKQLEGSNALLHDAESEIASLKGIIENLENEHKEILDESDRCLYVAQQEALASGKTVEVLKSKLQAMEEENFKVASNEKVAVSNIESLLEERKKLINELEISRDEAENAKRAMDGLASALHEVSTKARETQERLLTKQAESADVDSQIEELKLVLNNTEESYEVMLDEARYEIVCLKNAIERYETEANTSRSEWNAKELDFVSAAQKSEEEISSLKVQLGKMVDSLNVVEHDAQAATEAAAQVKSESLRLKERLLDNENELQGITQENDELRIREADSKNKIRELSSLLSELTAKKIEENSEVTNSEEEYDLLPIPKEENGKLEDIKTKDKNGSGNLNDEEELVEVEAKMWESCKIMETRPASEREHDAESTDDEIGSQIDRSSFNQMNGLPTEKKMGNGTISPTKSRQPKKKKDLLQKFGSMLKKKNHK